MLLVVFLLSARECLAEIDPRIIGGEPIEIHQAPWVVSYGGHCGGSVVGEQWILTAAHCGKEEFVKVASTTLNIRYGKILEVEKYFPHPNFNTTTNAFDFQMVKLKNKLTFDSNVTIIRIGDEKDITPGTRLTTAGYGSLLNGEVTPGTLTKAHVTIANERNCKNEFTLRNGTYSTNVFCSGYEMGHKGGCKGDGGNPVAFKGNLLGVLSYGYSCGTPLRIDVYGKVPLVKKWITDTMLQNRDAIADDECACELSQDADVLTTSVPLDTTT